MDGWLAYHAVFVAAVCAALYRCDTDPRSLAADRATLGLMCEAITQGFRAPRADGVGGQPRNLAILHHPWLRPVARRYWVSSGFAVHARHAEGEMRLLAQEVVARIPASSGNTAIRSLLATD